VPVLKYTLFAGASLLALLVISEQFIAAAPNPVRRDSSSLDVLRKMANHGHSRGFAPLAAAGAFVPMSVPAIDVAKADETPAPVAAAAVETKPAPQMAPAVLNAQASLQPADLQQATLQSNARDKAIAKKIARSTKKVAARKPKAAPRIVYVENRQSGFFGTW
jgi:hypothetical protein